MMQRHILRSQKNDVLEAVRSIGLDPTDFTWSVSESPYMGNSFEISKLVHRPTGYYFMSDFPSAGTETHAYEFTPSEQSFVSVKSTSGSWPGQLNAVKRWLRLIKRESIDLWSALGAEHTLLEAAVGTSDDNSEFSEAEKQKIVVALAEIREFIATGNALSQEQLTVLDDRVRYLQDSANRLGRKDWINVALGVLTSLVLQLALPGDPARDVFRFAVKALEWVMQGAAPLLP
jgi:hypothetical protein